MPFRHVRAVRKSANIQQLGPDAKALGLFCCTFVERVRKTEAAKPDMVRSRVGVESTYEDSSVRESELVIRDRALVRQHIKNFDHSEFFYLLFIKIFFNNSFCNNT